MPVPPLNAVFVRARDACARAAFRAAARPARLALPAALAWCDSLVRAGAARGG